MTVAQTNLLLASQADVDLYGATARAIALRSSQDQSVSQFECASKLLETQSVIATTGAKMSVLSDTLYLLEHAASREGTDGDERAERKMSRLRREYRKLERCLKDYHEQVKLYETELNEDTERQDLETLFLDYLGAKRERLRATQRASEGSACFNSAMEYGQDEFVSAAVTEMREALRGLAEQQKKVEISKGKLLAFAKKVGVEELLE